MHLVIKGLSCKTLLSGRAAVLISAGRPGDSLYKSFSMSLASSSTLSPSWSRLYVNSSRALNQSLSMSELNCSRTAVFRLTYEPFSLSNEESKMAYAQPCRNISIRLNLFRIPLSTNFKSFEPGPGVVILQGSRKARLMLEVIFRVLAPKRCRMDTGWAAFCSNVLEHTKINQQ